MPIELAGQSGDEGGWNEHCAQHQGDGDQRRTDLIHASLRGVTRRQAGGNVALDVLDHDDRIVDHNPDREHQAKQRQIVEREPEHRHEEKSADQRHRNRHDRNDGGAPGLQEQDDDQDDQDDRLDDGLGDGIDGLLDELGRVVDDGVFEACRKFLRELVHCGFDLLGRRQRVRARQLVDGERNRRVEIAVGVGRVVDGGELDPAHVLEANDRGRALLDHDVGELLRVDQPSERPHRYLESTRLGNRRLVEHAGSDLDVLALQGRDDIPCGEPKRV